MDGVVVVCLIGIVCCGIVSYFFRSNKDETNNDNSDDNGCEGTMFLIASFGIAIVLILLNLNKCSGGRILG